MVAEKIVSSDVIASDPKPNCHPGFLVAAVVHEPMGSHPSPCQGYYGRDHAYYGGVPRGEPDAGRISVLAREVGAFGQGPQGLLDGAGRRESGWTARETSRPLCRRRLRDVAEGSQLEMSFVRDKVAVVTGSSRGIGRAIAESLAREGARVVVSGRNAKDVERAVGEMNRRRSRSSGHGVRCAEVRRCGVPDAFCRGELGRTGHPGQ